MIYLLRNGQALQSDIRLGPTDGEWIEVIACKRDGIWAPLNVDDQIIQGDMDEIEDGQAVKLTVPQTAPVASKAAKGK